MKNSRNAGGPLAASRLVSEPAGRPCHPVPSLSTTLTRAGGPDRGAVFTRPTVLLHLVVVLAGFLAGQPAAAAPAATELRATYRHGQVFLTWQEAATPPGTTFNVYVAGDPIAEVAAAKQVGHHIEPRSAMDWWENPAAMNKQKAADRTHGFRLTAGGPALDPAGGLFVHTVQPGTRTPLFFAVTHSAPGGREDRTLVAGQNTTTTGLVATPGPIEPIWQGKGDRPPAGAGAGLPLSLSLHGKSGVIAESEYLVFGDTTMAWREGIAFKFSVRVQNNEVVVRPTDRTWINRNHDEAGDGGTPAIWTFWYGTNSQIFDRSRMKEGTPTNYTEQRLLWILNWVQRHYQTDRNRWYCSGSSMGGCGTISFGLRHPELFAACHAHVPIVSYTYADGDPGRSSARRLEPAQARERIGPDVLTNEGVPLLERMNGTKFVAETKDDLPFLFILNGRQDGSIPWGNNPPFYRALDGTRQGFAAYWDNGEHSTVARQAPADIKAWSTMMRRFRRNESFPVFSRNSSNRNPGAGDPADGDIVGWMNRGLDWSDLEDAADHYAITLRATFPDITYPVHTDVTLRRVQQFKARAGERLQVQLRPGTSSEVQADAQGRITVPAVVIPGPDGVRLVIRRS